MLSQFAQRRRPATTEEFDRLIRRREFELCLAMQLCEVLQRRERDRQQGAEEGAAVGAEAIAEGGHVLPDEEAWDVLEEIPNDSAAALILLEHHWAVPLRDAVVRAGGFRISDGFISPRDLVEIGLHSAEEAEALHALETAAQND